MNNALPKGWASCAIGDITLPIGTIDQNAMPSRAIRYIDISGIDNATNHIAETKSYVLSEAPSRARQVVQAGDTVFSTVRPYLRNIAQVPADLDGEVASTGFCVLRPATGINARFLFFKATSQPFVDALTRVQYGASYPAVKDDQVRAQPFALPPAAEQERIVEKIEMLFAELDKGEEALRTVQKLLVRYRQSVLKAAVTGALTADWRAANGMPAETGHDLLSRILKHRRETWQGRGRYKEPVGPNLDEMPDLPESWTWASIDQLSSSTANALCIGPFGSNLKVDDYRGSGVPLIFVRHIRAGDFDGLDPKFVTESKARELSSHRVLPGDLLITKMGDPPGDVVIYPEDAPTAIITADCIRFAVTDAGVSKPFTLHAMRSKLVQDQIHAISKGVAQQKVTLAEFKRIAIPLPPEREQLIIAQKAGSIFDDMRRLEEVPAVETTRSAALRQSILKDAFAGKLVSQDPADEPAAVLLARIRASRAAAPKRARRKVRA